jgi:hypothetical protein
MKEQPDILLLQETKCAGDEATQILTKCWKQEKIAEVDAKGTTGGLAILWNPTTILMEGFLPPNGLSQPPSESSVRTSQATYRMSMAPQPRETRNPSSNIWNGSPTTLQPMVDTRGRLQHDNWIGGKKGGTRKTGQ